MDMGPQGLVLIASLNLKMRSYPLFNLGTNALPVVSVGLQLLVVPRIGFIEDLENCYDPSKT